MEREVREYINKHGWHFSEKLCSFAVSQMKKNNGTSIIPYTKEEIDTLLKRHNVQLKNTEGYDYVYVANMAKADFLGSSITDEQHLILYVKDYIDDPDGYHGLPMSRYYADTIGKGIEINWEEML